MRALTLEDQVRDVIGNKMEIDGSMDAIINTFRQINHTDHYSQAFPKLKIDQSG